MGLQVKPAYIGQTGYTHPVELDRNILESIFGRTGAMRYGDFALTPLAGLNLRVGAGSAFILGQESGGASQGGYYAWSNGNDDLAWPAAPATKRIDTLLLRVKDDQYGTITGTPEAYYDIVQGVASATPSARVDADFLSGGGFYVPGAWWRIANVEIDNGDTTINPARIFPQNLFRRGTGYTLCLSTARPTDKVFGDKLFELDTFSWIWWDGAAWRLFPKCIGHAKTGSQINNITSETTLCSMTGRKVFNAREYTFQGTVKGNASVASVPYVIRIRQGTALSGTVLQEWVWWATAGGGDDAIPFTWEWECGADNTNSSFHLSILRLSGTGDIDVYVETNFKLTENKFTAE